MDGLAAGFTIGVGSITIFFAILSFAYFLIKQENGSKRQNYCYLYYSGYCLSICVLITRNWLNYKESFPIDLEDYLLLFQSLPVWLYSGFVYFFLDDMKSKDKKPLYYYFISLSILLFLYNILSFLFPSLTKDLTKNYPLIIIPLGFIGIIFIFARLQSHWVKYVIIGSLGIAIGAAFSHIPVLRGIIAPEYHNLQIPFQIGALIDVVVIAIALIRKNNAESNNISAIQIPLFNNSGTKQIESIKPTTNNNTFQTTLDAYISENLPTIKAGDLPKVMGINRKKLNRQMKDFTNLSPKEYIDKLRIREACKLLKTTDKSVGEIGLLVVGDSNFSRFFRDNTGMSPSKYRDKNGKK